MKWGFKSFQRVFELLEMSPLGVDDGAIEPFRPKA